MYLDICLPSFFVFTCFIYFSSFLPSFGLMRYFFLILFCLEMIRCFYSLVVTLEITKCMLNLPMAKVNVFTLFPNTIRAF